MPGAQCKGVELTQGKKLTGIILGNYRSLATPTLIPLKPLTLLFGYNSAGKSAILRSLPLLASSARAGTSGPINLSAAATRGATFRDLTSKYTDSDVISLGMTWDHPVIGKLEYRVRDLPDQRRQVVEYLAAFDRQGASLASFEWVPQTADQDGEAYQFKREASDKATETSTVNLRFEGLSPQTETSDEHALAMIELISELLSDLSKSVTWLNALRCSPPRWSLLSGKAEMIGPDGNGISQALALAPENVLDEVSKWYEEATGYRMSVSWGAVKGREVFSITAQPAVNSAVALDVVDTGEGIGQALPVVGLLCLAKHGQLGANPILAIEHPELHLHPDAHTGLADLFCDVASGSSNSTLVVETHSENFLLAVQLAIVEKRISNDTVAVYWVRETPKGAVVDLIRFDELGRPEGNNWPPGVFGETADSSKRLFMARRKMEADARNSNA